MLTVRILFLATLLIALGSHASNQSNSDEIIGSAHYFHSKETSDINSK
ncbi:MAG: hypothetical protein AB8E15_07055 [Bdellovibrionales bacterium]